MAYCDGNINQFKNAILFQASISHIGNSVFKIHWWGKFSDEQIKTHNSIIHGFSNVTNLVDHVRYSLPSDKVTIFFGGELLSREESYLLNDYNLTFVKK